MIDSKIFNETKKEAKETYTLSHDSNEHNVMPNMAEKQNKKTKVFTPSSAKATNKPQTKTKLDTIKKEIQRLTETKASIKNETDDFISQWPADTVLDKKDLLVELDYQELQKLKIFTDGYYLFYANGSTTRKINKTYIPDSCKIISTDPFVKKYTSTINYELFSYITSDFMRKRYHESIDTLVPIVINLMHNQSIWWFNPHPVLFEKLPEQYKHLQSVYKNLVFLKQKYPNRSFTNFISSIPKCEPLNALELTPEQLRNIGINSINNHLILQANISNRHYISSYCTENYLYIKEDLDSLNLVRIKDNDFPLFKTTKEGYRHVYPGIRRPFKNEIPEDISTIIAVKVDVGMLKGGKSKVEYWWFKTTDTFITNLPYSIQNQLRIERDIIHGTLPKSASTSCTYFEACKSNLDVNDLTVYPNPAQDHITIKFTLDNEIQGDIQLLSISGQSIKSLVSKTTFMQGENEFSAEVSGVQSGIYLISIITEQGFITRRLIISD